VDGPQDGLAIATRVDADGDDGARPYGRANAIDRGHDVVDVGLTQPRVAGPKSRAHDRVALCDPSEDGVIARAAGIARIGTWPGTFLLAEERRDRGVDVHEDPLEAL